MPKKRKPAGYMLNPNSLHNRIARAAHDKFLEQRVEKEEHIVVEELTQAYQIMFREPRLTPEVLERAAALVKEAQKHSQRIFAITTFLASDQLKAEMEVRKLDRASIIAEQDEELIKKIDNNVIVFLGQLSDQMRTVANEMKTGNALNPRQSVLRFGEEIDKVIKEIRKLYQLEEAAKKAISEE